MLGDELAQGADTELEVVQTGSEDSVSLRLSTPNRAKTWLCGASAMRKKPSRTSTARSGMPAGRGGASGSGARS